MADPKTGKSTRIGHEINKDGKKVIYDASNKQLLEYTTTLQEMK